MQLYVIDFTRLSQVPDCEYTPIYTSSVQGDPTGTYTGTNDWWPAYMTFANSTEDQHSSMNYKIHSDNVTKEGEHIDLDFTITFVNELDPNNAYVDSIVKIPWQLSFVYFPYNTAPKFYSSI